MKNWINPQTGERVKALTDTEIPEDLIDYLYPELGGLYKVTLKISEKDLTDGDVQDDLIDYEVYLQVDEETFNVFMNVDETGFEFVILRWDDVRKRYYADEFDNY